MHGLLGADNAILVQVHHLLALYPIYCLLLYVTIDAMAHACTRIVSPMSRL